MLTLLRREGPAGAARLATENLAVLLGPSGPQRVRRWYLRRDARRFDQLHGTDTYGFIDWGAPELGAYEASDEASFDAILEALGTTTNEFTFVDVGAGKAKAALLASRHPFREVLGVERAPDLCRVARRNVEIWEHARTAVRIQEGDATTMELPSGPLLLYLFNPFGPATMARFLEHVRRACDREPRRVVLAYYNAIHADALDETEWLQPLGDELLLLYGNYRAWDNNLANPPRPTEIGRPRGLETESTS